MPLPRTNAKEHPSASHSDWGGSLKFVVQPVMAKHPDQPDKWTVSGVARSYASKQDADQVRAFLKKNPPSHVKDALSQGKHVDDMLPGHLQRLPRWDDVHGIGVKKESAMSDRMAAMLHLLGEHVEGCGCEDANQTWWQQRDAKLTKKLPKGTSAAALKKWQKKDAPKMKRSFESVEAEAVRFKQRDPGERQALVKGIRMMRRFARSKWQGTDVVRGARKGMADVVKAGGGTGKRYEGIEVFSSLAVTEALERAKESLECGCIDKMEWAAEDLAMAMCEAGCPPMQHINQKLGRCAPIPDAVRSGMQKAGALSTKVRKPEDHERAAKAHHEVATDLHGAGFHKLAATHAARANAHRMATAN